MTHTVSLSSGSQQLENPLGDHGAIIGKLLGIKYNHTPLSPLQRAQSWWTRLGSYHEEQKIFGDQVSWRRVLRIALPLKEQDLSPHRNIFIQQTSRARHRAAPKEPSMKGNHKHSECEQPHHIGHGYPLNSERQFRNTSLHKLDMDTLSYLRDSSAARRR